VFLPWVGVLVHSVVSEQRSVFALGWYRGLALLPPQVVFAVAAKKLGTRFGLVVVSESRVCYCCLNLQH
jgi:hypothetical protein